MHAACTSPTHSVNLGPVLIFSVGSAESPDTNLESFMLHRRLKLPHQLLLKTLLPQHARLLVSIGKNLHSNLHVQDSVILHPQQALPTIHSELTYVPP